MDCESQRCSLFLGKVPYQIYSLICLLAYLLALTPLMVSASSNATEYQAKAYRTFGSIEIDGDLMSRTGKKPNLSGNLAKSNRMRVTQ